MPPTSAPGPRLASLWRKLAPWPAGSWIFSRILGIIVPYTSTIGARVRVLEPGFARVELPDHRRVRNHLNSIHAIALANLGEVTSGLAMLTGLPDSVRGIVTSLSVQFLKKARGTLVAECRTAIPVVTEPVEYQVTADIRDAASDVVARVVATWRLSPVVVESRGSRVE